MYSIILPILLLITTLLPSLGLSATRNLLPNSSFEITTVGDMPDWYYQYGGPQKVEDWYDHWSVDKASAFHGKNSVRLSVLKQSHVGKLSLRQALHEVAVKYQGWEWVKENGSYTFSVYMKSDQAEGQLVKVRFGENHSVVVGKQWQRYSFTAELDAEQYKLPDFAIVAKGTGVLWIDAVQLEKGKVPSPFQDTTPADGDIFPVKLSKTIMADELDDYVASTNENTIIQVKTGLSYYSTEKDAELIVEIDPSLVGLGDVYLSVEIFREGFDAYPVYSKEGIDFDEKERLLLVDLAELSNSVYKVVVALKTGKGAVIGKAVTSLYKYSSVPNEVKIDHVRRVLLVNGKPFMLAAACFLRVHDSYEHYKYLLNKIKSHGYTCVIATFSNRSNEDRLPLAEIRNFFDYADQIGLKVIPWVNPNAVKDGETYKGVKSGGLPAATVEQLFKEEINRLVPSLRSHPALLAWYPIDEPWRKYLLEHKITSKLTKCVKTLDPYHPVMLNYGNIRYDYQLHSNTLPGDIISLTQYPVPLKPLTDVAKDTAFEVLAAEGRKPVGLWLQFWGGKGRYPTADEFSCMFYLALIAGANSIQTWPMMPNSKALWDKAKEVITEFKQLFPIITAENNSDHFVTSTNAQIFFTVRQFGESFYLIAVNPTEKHIPSSFFFGGGRSLVHVADFFTKDIISHNGETIEYEFKPLEKCVFEFTLKKDSLLLDNVEKPKIKLIRPSSETD